MDAEIVETGVSEIAEHGRRRSVLHGVLVLGLPPQCRFGLMAASAGFAADKGGSRGRLARPNDCRQHDAAIDHKRQCGATQCEGCHQHPRSGAGQSPRALVRTVIAARHESPSAAGHGRIPANPQVAPDAMQIRQDGRGVAGLKVPQLT